MTRTPSTPIADLWPTLPGDARPEAAHRLLQAAVASFAERGFHATTTRDIATAAGMSPAALYIHYQSKAALLAEISQAGHAATLALVCRAAAGEGDPAQRMRGLVEQFTAWHARARTVGRVVNYELHALPEDAYAVVAALRLDIEREVSALIEAGVAAGAFQVAEVRTAARAVTSLGIDVSRWYTDRSTETPEELGRRYGELVLRMLGAEL
ncbi:TetR/AcrR family transcriptional regulator [Streptomyces rubellomurinus]|uniref:TetR family transcriptional regulator n=1 Tax=Streptomyces rubellomurinus (strain ATCC 31215) TaxID=359131 RepID=A0A0F2T9T4_STRR3|nr:TetR/AcrR family transcriptional regulator [Streptomyces rubellomurinus]KJS59974.1 TetR family transcriptional regulator [Streptomyces rubellomurinus]